MKVIIKGLAGGLVLYTVASALVQMAVISHCLYWDGLPVVTGHALASPFRVLCLQPNPVPRLTK